MYKNEWSVHSNEIKWKGAIKEASLQSFTVLAFTSWNTKMIDQARPLCWATAEEGGHISWH